MQDLPFIFPKISHGKLYFMTIDTFFYIWYTIIYFLNAGARK